MNYENTSSSRIAASDGYRLKIYLVGTKTKLGSSAKEGKKMPKTIELSELIVDFVDDNKEFLAKYGQMKINKQLFIKSVNKHRKINSRSTKDDRWAMLSESSSLVKIGTRSDYMFLVANVLVEFVDVSGRINSLLIEGDKLNDERLRADSKLKMCTHTHTHTQPEVPK